MNLAIKGHKTRGAEVINLLEMLGGRNLRKLAGTDPDSCYIINNDETISGIINVCLNNKYVRYTIEEFLEKFPYKVGDRVRVPEYESEVHISEMYWDGSEVQYEVVTNETEWYSAKELNEFNEPYKEETMETMENNIIDTVKESEGRYRIVLNHQFDMEVDEGEYYAVRRKPQYPKTYKECCEVLMGKTDFQDFELVLTKLSINQAQSGINIFSPVPPHITLINNFYKLLLLICRDAYWKIAGKEMGLGKPWQPDYHEKSYEQGSPIKYVIYYTGTHITKEQKCTPSYILAFPTEKMRNVFFENFKELIEQCKELL